MVMDEKLGSLGQTLSMLLQAQEEELALCMGVSNNQWHLYRAPKVGLLL